MCSRQKQKGPKERYTQRKYFELHECKAAIKIARRNINNLRYADDTTPMTESKEKLKSLLMRVKEETEKAALKHNIQEIKTIVSGPIT